MSEATAAAVTDTAYELKDIDLVDPSPLNPRKMFNQEKLRELADSIKQVGIVEPLVVRPTKKGRVEIVAGERRYRAAKLAGLSVLPCVLRSLTDEQAIEMMAVENDQRDDVHPLERGVGYQSWMRINSAITPEAIATRIGKSKRYVQLCLQYLTLIPEAQQAFRDNRITAGHADLLVRLKSDEQRRALAACFEELSLIAMPDSEQDAIYEAKYSDESVLLTKGKAKSKLPPVEVPYRLRSVREMGDWIDTHIKADRADLQSAFPELDEAVVEAETEGRKVVEISHLTRNDVNAGEMRYDQKTLGANVPDPETNREAANALRRVVFAPNWRPANISAKDPKLCDYAVLGVVTFGHGKGEQQMVCVNKKACRTHWSAPEKRGDGGGYDPAKWKEEQERAQAERERKEKVYRLFYPLVVKAIAAKLPKKLDRKAFGFIWNGNKPPKVPEAQFVEALILDKLKKLDDSWARTQLLAAASYWGVDAKKIELAQAAESKATEMRAAGATVVKLKPGAKKKPVAKKRPKLGKGKK